MREAERQENARHVQVQTHVLLRMISRGQWKTALQGDREGTLRCERKTEVWCFRSKERCGSRNKGALAGVAQLVGHCPAKQKVAGLIPSQGTCLGCRFISCGA